MLCPVTGVEMTHKTLHGVEVDESDAGIWLDKGELFAVTEAERVNAPEWLFADLFRSAQVPPVDRSRVLKCPRCSDAMEVHRHHDIHLDWCKDHGVWLDTGEFDALLNNLRLDPHFLNKITTRLWELRF